MLSDNTFIFKMFLLNVKIKSKSKQLRSFFSKADTQNFVPNVGILFSLQFTEQTVFMLELMKPGQ